MKVIFLFFGFFLLCFDGSGNQTGTSNSNGDSSLNYTFTYNYQMDMKGKILFFITYRFYYEASASVNFISKVNKKDQYDFFFNGIKRTGYVMTTGGLTGNSLYFFTADYSKKNSTEFSEKKINSFKITNPYYAKNIKKIRLRPMVILSKNPKALRFTRDKRGIHYHPEVNIRLTDSHSHTYSNIYKILGKWLMAYNHSFLPKNGNGFEGLKYRPDQYWYSSPLDFSRVLEAAAKLSSRRAEKQARFKQEKRFQLQYRIKSHKKNFLEICGESFPNVRIWKNMKIKHVLRKVKLRLNDSVVMEDSILLNFRDTKGRGGTVRLNLYIN